MKPRLDIHFTLHEQMQFVFGKLYREEKEVFLVNHCRSAILLTLQAFGLPAGASVGVMAFNCHTVVNAVEQAGYKPVFLDVTDNLQLDFADLSIKVGTMSALIVTHLFGIINDVKRIREAYPELCIIEDCAHAYGIEKFYGDFAVFSIGQGKFPSIGDGGVLYVCNDKFYEGVDTLYRGLPDYSPFQSVHLFLRMLGKSFLYLPLVYTWLTLPLKRKFGTPSAKERIVPMKMCPGISGIYADESGKMSKELEWRKKRALALSKVIPSSIKKALIGCNGFMLVILCENPSVLQAEYRKRGIDTDTHFAHCLDWAAEFGYQKGQCPNTEKMVHHLLMVPTYR